MNINNLITDFEWVFILFFVLINTSYLILTLLSMQKLLRHVRAKFSGITERPPAGFETPVSILVPAFNEAATIVPSLDSIMQLNYPEYEIIVINDGSTDDTLEVLKNELDLIDVYVVDQIRVKTQPVRSHYQSLKYKKIRVIDKENGGKSDALNAGINASFYPLFCCVDADSVLENDSMINVVQPFLEDPDVIAAGGTIRIANGCLVRNGRLEKIGIPKNPLALVQVVEYLHAFLFGRMGWVPLNSLLIISGAFSLFVKEHVIAVGGYRTDTVGEDMELIIRLHKHMRYKKQPYKITFVAEPICWTEAPERLETLRNQRVRWHRGLGESLFFHKDILFNPKMGIIGFFAYPFALFFEFFSPALELAGYFFFFLSMYLGIINQDAFKAFLIAAVGLGILLSVSAILLEEMTFQVYKKKRYILMLLIGAVFENIGYRQLNSFWRLVGFIKFSFGTRREWGRMKRHGLWQAEDRS